MAQAPHFPSGPSRALAVTHGSAEMLVRTAQAKVICVHIVFPSESPRHREQGRACREGARSAFGSEEAELDVSPGFFFFSKANSINTLQRGLF